MNTSTKSSNEALSNQPRWSAVKAVWSDWTVWVLIVLFIVAGVVLCVHQAWHQTRLLETTMLSEAERYTDALREFRTLYTREVVQAARSQGVLVTHDYDAKKHLGKAIPLPATLSMKLGNELAKKQRGGQTKLYSAFPFPYPGRPKLNERDEFAQMAWSTLAEDPSEPFYRFETVEGKRFLRYATADLMRQSCVHCHNTHPDTPRRGWKLNDVRGVLEVTLPVETASAQAMAGRRESFALFAGFGAVGLIGLTLVIGRVRRYARELEYRVTERTEEWERANAKLAREQYLLNALVDNLPDAIFFKDREGRFIRCNRGMAEYAGVDDPSQIVGRTDADIWGDGLPADTLADEQRIIETGEPVVNKEERVVPKDGGPERWVLVTKTPLRDENSGIVGTLGIAHDITQRKHHEQELERINAQLTDAKEAAEEANRAKSEFLANMSHEIRTPMNGIIGFTELLMMTELSPKQREDLGVVQQSADHLLRLLNDILDFSKIEAGKLELEYTEFGLRDYLGDTMQVLASKADEKGLELAFHIPPNVPDALLGDPGRLRQIVMNLVGNAIKFTPEGEVVVAVHAEEAANENVRLHFMVRDTGIGIPPEKQHLVFESFRQVDASTTRQFGGTGLGLAISSQLVRLMNGEIWLESEVGVGTTFHFTAVFDRQQKAPKRPAGLSTIRGLPALVVDDTETNRRIYTELLFSWGMKATSVASGPLALLEMRRAEKEGAPYRVVVLDMMMPEMDGLELARRITADRELTDCVMILLSSAGRPGDVERSRELGIDRCLAKPVKHSDLLNAILFGFGVPAEEASTPSDNVLESAKGMRPLRILLAEDGVVNQRVAQGFLEPQGHQLVVAVNGREAVEAWQRETFDLVLMDVQMPEMDGFEATAEIRRQEAARGRGRIPIIAMTAHAMKGDRQRCLEAGMDDYIAKPIDAKELFEAIRRVTGAFESSDHPQTTAEPTAMQDPEKSDRDVLDWDEALKHMPSEATLREIASLVIEESTKLVQQIHAAMAQSDSDTVHRCAHTIKGSAQTVCANGTAEAAWALECLARDGKLEEFAAALAVLEQEVAHLVSALSAKLNRG